MIEQIIFCSRAMIEKVKVKSNVMLFVPGLQFL